MESKQKMKRTEVLEGKRNELPSGWELKKLDEIFEITAGGDIEKEFVRETKDEEFKYPIFANAGKNKGLYGYSNRYKIDVECITLSGRGEIGLANARFEKFYPIVRLLVLKPKQTMDLIFIENYLNKLNIHQESTGVPQLTVPQTSKYRILIPPLPEQLAIANILSTWDSAINLTQNLISQKEAEKKWLMQNLLTGKKRLKGFSEDWKENKLSDLFSRVTRKNIEENTNVITISAQRGFVKQTDFFNKKVASDILLNYFLVEKGEFCYNKSYSNGYPWGATKRLNDFEKAVVTTLYICFKISDKKSTSGDYFEQFFNANKLDQGLTKIAHEGGRAHGLLNVTPSDFFSLKIISPPFDEQTAIAQVLQTADKEIELLKSKLAQQKLQKKGLMQVLLTGRVRVKNKLNRI